MWLLLASNALAFEVLTTPSGDETRWLESAVAWSLAEPTVPEGLSIDAIVDSFAAWEQSAEGALDFRRVDDVAALHPEALDGNTVAFVTDWEWGSDVLALSATWTDSAGEIRGFDLLINGDIDWVGQVESDGLDLQYVVTHELGHALGIGHSEVRPAIMYPSVLADESSRHALHADDERAIQYLYPSVEDEWPSVSRFGGCGNVQPGAMVWGIGMLALGLVVRV